MSTSILEKSVSKEGLLEAYRELIDSVGYTVVGVNDFPSFAYSIGMAKHNLPDIFIVGEMEYGKMLHAIETVYRRWMDGGYRLGKMDNAFGYGLDLDIQAIENVDRFYGSYAHLNTSFYRAFPSMVESRNGVPDFVQVMWPDECNTFPYEFGYDAGIDQPIFVDLESMV